MTTLRWGILGAGDIADRHMAPAIQRTPGHELAAVARRTAAAAQAFALKHGARRWCASAEALLADPEVDAVYVATPPAQHCDLTLLAAAAGKHILCEKPLALSSVQIETMISACYASGARLMVCHYQRFNERHIRLKNCIQSGALGQVTNVRMSFSNLHPPTTADWRRDRAMSGGGPLMDLGTHCLDLLIFLFGKLEMVHACVDELVWSTEVEDTATLLLRLENGAHAIVSTHWSASPTSEIDGNCIEVCGTGGSILTAPIFSKDSSGRFNVSSDAGFQSTSHPSGPGVHDAVIDAFRQMIVSSGPCPAPAEDALLGMKIIEQAYASRQIVPCNKPPVNADE